MVSRTVEEAFSRRFYPDKHQAMVETANKAQAVLNMARKMCESNIGAVASRLIPTSPLTIHYCTTTTSSIWPATTKVQGTTAALDYKTNAATIIISTTPVPGTNGQITAHF